MHLKIHMKKANMFLALPVKADFAYEKDSVTCEVKCPKMKTKCDPELIH